MYVTVYAVHEQTVAHLHVTVVCASCVQKMSSNSSWLEVSGHGAKTTRFELPMDFKQLESKNCP